MSRDGREFGQGNKINLQHLERLAVVYVRQSTVQQVNNHQESTRLQYSLSKRAQALGWPAERVVVIDDDLGKSGSTSAGREGFARLVSEVGLGHVGLILGLEMSRLARSNKDWHHLLEICALAAEWEAKLLRQQQLQEDYARFLHQQPRPLTHAERETITHLAENIPILWAAATTTEADRKEIVRQVVERVTVANEGTSERLHLTIHWVGGGQSSGIVIRSVAKLEQLSYYPQLCERIRVLAQAGASAGAISEALFMDGYRPPRGASRFSRQAVLKLMQRLGVRQVRSRRRLELTANEWWLADLARHLQMPVGTLCQWVRRAWVDAYRHASTCRWVIRADAAEVARLKELRARPAGYYSRKLWLNSSPPELMVPRESE